MYPVNPPRSRRHQLQSICSWYGFIDKVPYRILKAESPDFKDGKIIEHRLDSVLDWEGVDGWEPLFDADARKLVIRTAVKIAMGLEPAQGGIPDSYWHKLQPTTGDVIFNTTKISVSPDNAPDFNIVTSRTPEIKWDNE